MPCYFCLTIRFQQPYYHGRADGGEPEWPPSPLRAFQSLVAAAAARWREAPFRDYAVPALRWLEELPLASIVAPPGQPAKGKYRLYVPDNIADKVAKSWTAGREASIGDYRTEKDVRPVHLNGGALHYLFPIPDDDCSHREVLTAAARSITHLGWGVDMVVGNATVISDAEMRNLLGERWHPVEGSWANGYRVPIPGTLENLLVKHVAFLNRIGSDGFKPVPALSAFRMVAYRRDTDAETRPNAAFQLLTPDSDSKRAFDPLRTVHVAAMTRHATAQAARAAGKPEKLIAGAILGHDGNGRARGAPNSRRLAYLPLPTIDPRNVVSGIRRVMIAEPLGGNGRDANWIRQLVTGQELTDANTREPQAVMALAPQSEWVTRHYWQSASTWSTVSPVVLPGHDDHHGAKTDRLLRKAIRQAGYSDILTSHADLDWRPVGFWRGTDLAGRYIVPQYLKGYPRYHVRITWRDETGHPILVPGPVTIGSGRYCGLGLFAGED